MQLKFPEMRYELEGVVEGLADPAYQRRVWVDGLPEDGVVHDEFGYAVHFLFDDTQLAEDAQSMIGWVLRDASEAEAVTALVRAIDVVFDCYGTKLSDAEYIEVPEWRNVVLAAQAAWTALHPIQGPVARHEV